LLLKSEEKINAGQDAQATFDRLVRLG